MGEVMSPSLVCVGPELDLATVAAEMLAQSIGGCPVVDDDGRAVGFVSKTDLLCASVKRPRQVRASPRSSRRRPDGPRVRDVMTSVLFSVAASASLAEGVELLARSGVHHLVVEGEDGKAVGVLSAMDVVRYLASR